jgi:hypothetical protein
VKVWSCGIHVCVFPFVFFKYNGFVLDPQILTPEDGLRD